MQQRSDDVTMQLPDDVISLITRETADKSVSHIVQCLDEQDDNDFSYWEIVLTPNEAARALACVNRMCAQRVRTVLREQIHDVYNSFGQSGTTQYFVSTRIVNGKRKRPL